MPPLAPLVDPLVPPPDALPLPAPVLIPALAPAAPLAAVMLPLAVPEEAPFPTPVPFVEPELSAPALPWLAQAVTQIAKTAGNARAQAREGGGHSQPLRASGSAIDRLSHRLALAACIPVVMTGRRKR
jgi:hypothetical protein